MWDSAQIHVDENGMVGEGVKFERIRRITGYLVGTIDRFNNAKRCEEHDRIKHGLQNNFRIMGENENGGSSQGLPVLRFA